MNSDNLMVQAQQEKTLVNQQAGVWGDIHSHQCEVEQPLGLSEQTVIKNLTPGRKKEPLEESVSGAFSNQKELVLQVLNQHVSVSVTDATGKIIYANDKFCQSCGYQLDDLLGNTHRLIKSDVHPADFYQDLWRTIRAGKVWTGEVCDRSKKGDLYWTALTVVPFLREEGCPYQYVFIRTDISNTKQLQLESTRSSQMKSEFMSNMSHELRTPMSAIFGFAQVLEHDNQLNEDQLDTVGEICNAAKHLKNLINDVLHLSKIESGYVELSVGAIKLAEVVSECCDLVALSANQAGVSIQLGDLDGCWVQADRTRLKQILLNLLTNAVKYNNQGGVVTLFADAVNQQMLRVTVGDNGPGISPEKQRQLFQPFNRLGAEQSEIEGTGIGLSIAQRLVTMMSGHIGVYSFEGIGSCFWVELPRVADNRNSAAMAPGSAGKDDYTVESIHRY
ncbi:PAS domain-containing sensor histidine kinase [Motiliproteus sp. MSK22-1]|uniref:PAS domain-containing sensor histidine kinase n=1 Tax=Motiliproteus sp. MSK22-1 TaxID=1897630 RepID=UPI0009777EF2|nr:PAS domain-containing sensor histidine kinase [Motiliproteus sp. MSK22-1]OMH38319.1 hypothetical protein BGP75_08735 [Motiliproteus sp. MSK22-1]